MDLSLLGRDLLGPRLLKDLRVKEGTQACQSRGGGPKIRGNGPATPAKPPGIILTGSAPRPYVPIPEESDRKIVSPHRDSLAGKIVGEP